MKLTNCISGVKVLDDRELDMIIETAFKILEHSGCLIEHNEILKRLKRFGATVDFKHQRVYFSKALIESFLSETNRKIWNDTVQEFSAEAEIYTGHFLDPVDNLYKPWNRERLLNTVKLADRLADIKGVYLLGCPIVEVPQKLQTLYEKIYCWKYGLRGGEGIWNTELCEPIYRMHEIYARSAGKEIQDFFHGTVYLISPLKLGRFDAEQFWYFYERGVKVFIRSGGGTLGGTFPVTIPGALAVSLAENLMTGIINYVLFQATQVTYIGSISSVDMRTAAFQYGRPEKAISIIAEAQIAKRMGFSYQGHSGLSDAKVPGFEAGVQKMTTAIYNASVSGRGSIVAGLLGADEIFSPLQMILENELTGALNHIGKGLDVNEETLAYEAIVQAGPGGNFLDAEHTALHFGSSLWQSEIYSDRMFTGWQDHGRKHATDLAREIYLEILHDTPNPVIFLSEETENDLMAVIRPFE